MIVTFAVAALAQEGRTFAEVEASCRAGNIPDCAVGGQLAQVQVDVDVWRSFDLYAAGCDGGDARACAIVGMRLWDGFGAGPDLALALTELEKGCNQGGEGFACGRYGDAIRLGAYGTPDLALAQQYYDVGCTLGDSSACAMGLAVAAGGPTSDAKAQKAAFQTLSKACERGVSPKKGPFLMDGDACFALANYHLTVLPSPALEAGEAALDAACAAGSHDGCMQLARFLKFPLEAPRDSARSLAMFTASCGSWADACFEQGLMAQEGRGMAPDHTEAERLFVKACDDGYPFGCLAAGDLWAHDPTTATFTPMQLPQDDARAAVLYERACERRLTAACTQREALRTSGRVP